MLDDMMHAMRALPPSLPTWTVAVLVAGALGFQSYVGLPNKVDQNTSGLEMVNDRMDADSVRTGRVICLIELQLETPEGVTYTPLETRRRCP